ncbi:MAG: FimV/HubP family polar landmark protein [Mariprofundus sp.]
MRSWLKHAVVVALPAIFFLCQVDDTHAASLGKIDVTSHVGEALYAEVPLHLDAGETVSGLSVEVANTADYRIFEVYRDPVLNGLRADVVSDARNSRVVLTSRSTIKTPFFNLVLKIRDGRVSSFRKYPLFLDVGKAVITAADRAPLPTVSVSSKGTHAKAVKPDSGQVVASPKAEPAAAGTDNWARANVYGPTVHGDSLWTMAQRLRADHRFNLNQVMVALFESNQDAFDKQNMNLLKANSMLHVPTAALVAKHSRKDAYRIRMQHDAAWKKLVKQPHFAAEAEAQLHRYSSHVSVGGQAAGTAVAASDSGVSAQAADVVKQPKPLQVVQPNASKVADSSAADAALTKANHLLTQVQQSNTALQQRLDEDRQRMQALQEKMDNLAIASSQARIGKLEILIARLQTQLEQKRPATPVVATTEWIVWLLAILVLFLIAVVVVLLRREPVHPGTVTEARREAVHPGAVTDELIEPLAQDFDAMPEQKNDSHALAAAIEDEVSGIEVGGDESPQMEPLIDALSDTDTVEMDSFSADDQAVDPDIDYVSEADIYIRYGMDEEALQQLDLALRLHPDNEVAHIKKAELLHAREDRKGLDKALAVASAALTGVALTDFQAAVTAMTVTTTDTVNEADDVPAEVAASDSDALQFDMDGLDDDDLLQFNTDKPVPDMSDQPPAVADDIADDATGAATEELDWLFNEVFDDDDAPEAETKVEEVVADYTMADLDMPVDDAVQSMQESMVAKADVEPVSADIAMTDQNEMDEFYALIADDASDTLTVSDKDDQLAVDTTVINLDDVDSESLLADVDDVDSVQHLDQLLGEFDQDDDLFISLDEDYSPVATGETIELSLDDDLLQSSDEQDLELSFFDMDEDDSALAADFTTATDNGQGGLQETVVDSKDGSDSDAEVDDLLGDLLGAFSDQDSDKEQGADALLEGLFSEFTDQDSQSLKRDKDNN